MAQQPPRNSNIPSRLDPGPCPLVLVILGAIAGAYGGVAVLRALHWFVTTRLSIVVVAVMALTAVDAIVVVQLIRIASPSVAQWTRARRWRLILVTWLALFVLSLTGVLLMRHRSVSFH